MGFPNKKDLSKTLKKLDKLEGTLALKSDATPLERFRFDLCQKFLKYKMSEGLNQKELAAKLGIDEAKISKILHHRISEFSTDRLIDLYYKINPGLKLKVS